MPEELASEAGQYAIELDAELDAIVLEWHGDTDGAAYRDPMERVLDLAETHDVAKLLCDATRQGVFEPADREWTIEEWTPEAVDAGITHTAFVYPDVRHGRLTVDATAREHVDMPFERIFVDSADEARRWLAQQ